MFGRFFRNRNCLQILVPITFFVILLLGSPGPEKCAIATKSGRDDCEKPLIFTRTNSGMQQFHSFLVDLQEPRDHKLLASDLSDATLESLVFEMTNNERTAHRLSRFKSSRRMDEVAFKHSQDMCNAGHLAHESDLFPQGRQKFRQRMESIGLTSGAENIAFHSYTGDKKKLAQKIVDGWMKSHEHRSNILNGKFCYIGLGVKNCKDGLIYITQLFSDSYGALQVGSIL